MLKKISFLIVVLGAVMLSMNIDTEMKDGILNVTLVNVEGLAHPECEVNSNGFTECPDKGETLVECTVIDEITKLEHDGEMDFCMSDGSGCAISPCYKKI